MTKDIFHLSLALNTGIYFNREIAFNFKLTVIPSQGWFVREGREGISMKIS